MDYPRLIVSNQKEESISIQRFNKHYIVGIIDIRPESRKSFCLKLDEIISDNTIIVSMLTRSKTVIRLHDNAFLHYCNINYMFTLHSQLVS